MTLFAGKRLGPYEIASPLGAGGMGEVYRARDTRLERDVAIKVLPPHLSSNPEYRARFEREAKAVAALSHPNILAVYDVGHQDGVAYVVTELLDGETLRQNLEDGALGRRRALEIGIAVSDGLAAAHARNIVHRDLKPENIFITKDGVVKILDFGLARLEDPSRPTEQHASHTPTVTLYTTPGTVLGTVNYMSPEQIRAQRTDGRSDVFSFGCVLYEMLTGERAFEGETSADTMTAILRESPKSIRTKRQDVGPDIERVIDRCLGKKPETRFQSSQDLAFTLRSILADSGFTKANERPSTVGRKPIGGGVVVAAILIASAFMLVRYGLNARKAEARPQIASVAVLPLENVSRDPEQDYFVDGMTEALISDLAKVSGLKVISRTSAMRYKGTNKSLPEIARELNVAAIVEGSVQRAGERVRITAQLIHAATDEHLWSESYDREMGDILRLQSEVARTIAEEIRGTLTPQEQARMAGEKKVNPEAYQAYLKGRFHWNKRSAEGLDKAVDYFEQAIAIAPNWPLGYAGLADAYLVMPFWAPVSPNEAIPKARAAALKALELDESVAEAHAALGHIATIFDWDWKATEREFQRALALNPNYATAHLWYAEYFLGTRRTQEALREIGRAQELDPLSLIIGSIAGIVHYQAEDWHESEQQFRNTIELNPGFSPPHLLLADTLSAQRKHAEAIAEAREAVRLSPNDRRCEATLGYVLAHAGHREEARQILDQLIAQSDASYVPPSRIAIVYAGLEEWDQAFEQIERAYKERDVLLIHTLSDRILAPVRSDPRLADLLRRMGLPPFPAQASMRTAPKASDKIMLAVLPFENLSRDPEQEYFSDGLTEEMIAQLGRINPQKLGVIARSSAMHYKNTDRTIDHVRRELGVDYVVEGSVRQADNRVRITANLIQCSDQAQLWADSFERELKDILALQSDVARAVAQEIKVALTPQEQASTAAARPVNPEAYQAYVKGRFYWNKRTAEDLKKSVRYFEQAISLAPDWPLGHVGLADTYVVMPFWAPVRPHEAIRKAKAAAFRALQLNDSLGEAHATIATISAIYDWNWETAEREFQRAIELAPNHATTFHWYSEFLRNTGRLQEALAQSANAQELDPLSLVIGTTLAAAHLCSGDVDQAEIQLRRVLELDPDYAPAHRYLAQVFIERGRPADAVAEARIAVRNSNDEPRSVAKLGYVCAMSGQEDEARKIVNQLEVRFREGYIPPTRIAEVYLGLQEDDRMFEWLEQAFQERDVLLTYALSEPIFGRVRNDPRFVDLVRRVGLPMPETQVPPAPKPDPKEPPGGSP